MFLLGVSEVRLLLIFLVPLDSVRMRCDTDNTVNASSKCVSECVCRSVTHRLQEDFLFFLLLSASCHEERFQTSASFQFYFKKFSLVY